MSTQQPAPPPTPVGTEEIITALHDQYGDRARAMLKHLGGPTFPSEEGLIDETFTTILREVKVKRIWEPWGTH